MDRTTEIYRLLQAHAAGEPGALDGLFREVYQELRRRSRRQLARAGRRASLDSTALVHELYLKLLRHSAAEWTDSQHFYAVASRAMRQIVLDYAKRTAAAKRGGAETRVTLVESAVADDAACVEIIALDQALTHLETMSPRLGQVVHLRFFTGLSIEETAQLLGVDPRTVKRDWTKARAFLSRELNHHPDTRETP